jgi:TolB-like protein/DNA-binding SARP family transcriptional activator
MDTTSALGNGNNRPVRWSLRLFGGFELGVVPGGERVTLPGKRERVLLAYLALTPNWRQPRRKLAALLWGDATDETLLDNLRASVWKLRKALSDTEHRIIASDGEDIVLDASAFDIDASAFVRLAAQSGWSELEAGANLFSGELLVGLDIDSEEYESWRRAEAVRYRDQAVDVLNRLMTQLVDCGEAERATEAGLRILRLEPLHEQAARRLMRLYAESGRRGTAIQLYRTLAEMLKTELDAQPEAETRALFADIARGGEETPAPTAAEAKPLPPTSIATPSVGPPSPPPPMPELAQEGPAIGAAQKVVPPQARKRPLGWIVAGGLAAAIALFLLYQFAGPVAQPTGIEAAKTASSSPAGTVAIAVLPFVNLSSDPEQEFFSDGMTEEITSALAKVPDLRVVGRTSAFQFKGQNQDLRAIGKSLAATHLIEGSVRKEGNRLRITAQLIEAENAVHLWAETYDRELTGVFAIQEEIATAIAGALRMPLGLKVGERLVSNRTDDLDSYQQYLRAKALVRARQLKPLSDGISLLQKVVAADPGFAPAWALLAQAHTLIPNYYPAWFSGSVSELRRIVDTSLPLTDTAARRAIQLDSQLPDGYLALGMAQEQRGKFLEAEELFSKALMLDTNNPDILHRYSLLMAEVGRVKEALAMKQQLRTLEPFVPVFNRDTAVLLWIDGQNEAALQLIQELPSRALARWLVLTRFYASMGRYSEAADALRQIPEGLFSAGMVEAAARLLRSAPKTAPAPETQPPLGYLGFVYLHVGAAGRALEFVEGNLQGSYLGNTATVELWHPSYAPARKTERFKAFARNAGLVEYWRAKGWPEFCHPTTGDDFECN